MDLCHVKGQLGVTKTDLSPSSIVLHSAFSLFGSLVAFRLFSPTIHVFRPGVCFVSELGLKLLLLLHLSLVQFRFQLKNSKKA